MDLNKSNYKTTLCRHFSTKGYCSLYKNCHFAHGQQDLRKRIDPIPNNIPPVLKPVSIYKTQMCKYFANGFCRNSFLCPFAHGQKDLHGMIVMSVNQQRQQKPDYGQAGQFLFSILRNLEQVFPEDPQRTLKIKRGKQKAKEGNLPEANQIITEIVGDLTLSERQREKCQTILTNAYSLHKINIIPF